MNAVVERENMIEALHRVERKFLGFLRTFHKEARLKVAPASVTRLKGKLRAVFRRGRGRNLERFITEDLNPLLKGWIGYFRLAEVKGIFEELDGWIRRKRRNLLWRQWKRPWTRARKLIRLGLERIRAWRSATNGRGPWGHSGASHMNQAACLSLDLNSVCVYHVVCHPTFCRPLKTCFSFPAWSPQ
ncbi:hypothetical protein CSA17_06080 [bacterium DOLJORAL78_65_58]|nr:MAG: hypothetical protein CSB20_13490 [bacterium DOLZORAL124_64_63]PIE75702.1 MAG: hypothetical protein CSA17_06080 [bacterium DOLJORAL78_65_58]